MKKFAIFIAIIVIFGLSGYIYAQVQNDKLSQPFTLTVGDWIANRIENRIHINRDYLSAPTYVYYDRENNVILVKIYGTRGYVDRAKESLMVWWNYINDKCIPYVKDFHNIELIESDFTVIYYDRDIRGGVKEIIRMEKGKLLLPQE